jgi:hypothetical protein
VVAVLVAILSVRIKTELNVGVAAKLSAGKNSTTAPTSIATTIAIRKADRSRKRNIVTSNKTLLKQ